MESKREKMNRHEHFFEMAVLVSQMSKDESTKCGCVIVGPGNEVRSTGYNSFPRGINDDLKERQERPQKYKWIEHAERNAIYNAARMGVSLVNCRLYQDWLPCADCARGIIQCGICEIIIDSGSYKNGNKEWEERWGESLRVSCTMIKEAGVKLSIFDRESKEIRPYDPDA
jgi:dCMP deaminase